MLVAWWVDLLRNGWLGAVFAVWMAATVLPVAALVLIGSIERAKRALARVPAALGLNAAPRRRLKSRFEESA